jgi:hypothetical protein
MELREYFAIWRRYSSIFWGVTLFFLIGGVVFQLFRPFGVRAVLGLNITRTGIQETDAYRFDEYYRMQADDKFSDTVVRWLAAVRTVSDIHADAEVDLRDVSVSKRSKIFKAQKLSSQFISVRYKSSDKKTAEKLAGSLVKILNQKISVLNEAQKEPNWFLVIGEDPVIEADKWGWSWILGVSLSLGVFVGLWGVAIRHYFS